MKYAKPQPTSRGFTLVELMIVVAIIGILGAIAYPSYVSSVDRGRRADAQKALLEASQFMQRYYVANNSYMDSAGKPPTLPGTLATTLGASGRVVYNVSVSNASQFDYTLKATRDSAGIMSQDDCGDFVLASTGARSLDNAKNSKKTGDCWR